MLVLGIETSCDETAAAVVCDGKLLPASNIIASQVNLHQEYGGVVPEIASRKHMETIIPVICTSLRAAGASLKDIEGIAVTRGPGLVGSLLVGLSVAKAVAFALKIPFVGVNHLEAHVAAVYLTEMAPQFPFVALVVSGGHTNIYFVKDFQNFQLLGQTKDDAAGEAFDKAAKLLQIGYPGGVYVERFAREGARDRIHFPRAMKESLDFSFSGLKTALLKYVMAKENRLDEQELRDVAASYQEAIVDVLVEKTMRAAHMCAVSSIVVCGGVAANERLRERFFEETEVKRMRVFIPPKEFCTDNAAMIAILGETLLKQGIHDSLQLNAVSRWPSIKLSDRLTE